MKKIILSISVGVVAALLMIGSMHATIKNINQLSAAQPSIEQLLAQLKSLQSQLAAKQAQVQQTYQFTRILKVGDKGEDVRQLQILLNKDISTKIAQSGDGSPGKETTYFGPATSRAVAKFQEKYKAEILIPNQLTKGTGTVGASTLKKLNALIAVTKTAGTPGNLAVTTQNPNVVNNLPTQTNNPSTTIQTTSTSSSLLPPINCGAPIITSASSASGTVGQAFSYSISITSIAAPTFSATGLPAGVTLSGSRISGIPTTVGTYTTTITATSNCGTGTKVVTITISSVTPPVSGTIITPGTGFTGLTPQPATIGSGFGVNAKAIARWDMVPYQSFTTTMNAAVVAFHINDIDHVSFSANGGPWTNVYSMTLNPETNVVEYWATLRASDFQDGVVELRAIVYPKVGIPVVLQGDNIQSTGIESLFVYANKDGSYTGPVRYVSPTGNDANDGLTAQTPKKDPATAIMSMNTSSGVPAGAMLYLLPGTHIWVHPNYPNNLTSQQRGPWLTISAAPGYSRNEVKVNTNETSNGSYMMALNRVHWKNVTFDKGQIPYMQAAGTQVWYETVTVDGQSRFSQTTAFAFGEAPGGRWLTDSIITNLVDGAQGFDLERNVAISNTLTGGPWTSPFVINTTVVNVDPGSTGAHPDVWRSMYSMTNVILYGFNTPQWDKQAGSQGIPLFIRGGEGLPWYDYNDIAFVNCSISSGIATYSIGGNLHNIYTKDSSFRGPSYPGVDGLGNLFYNGDDTVVFENVKWFEYGSGAELSKPPLFPNATYRPALATTTQTNTTTTSTSTNNTISTITFDSANGLVGYWPMNSADISGVTIYDRSGQGNNGTLVNTPLVVTGKFGQALSFNGGSQYINLGNPTALQLTNNFTVSAWINQKTAGGSWQQFFAGSSGDFGIGIGNTGQIRYTIINSADASPANTVIQTNQWYHVVVVNNAANIQYYINGVSDGSVGNPGTPSPGAKTIGLGTSYSSAFNGVVDDVRVYNRALSSSEVQALYTLSLAVKSQQSFMASAINAIGSYLLYLIGF